MSKKFSLISNLETKETVKSFQIFEVVMGFEKVNIEVPLEEADSFLKEVSQVKPKGCAGLLNILKQYNGTII